MDNIKISEYPKLIRDGIPEIILNKEGKKVNTRILQNNEEYLEFLFKKIIEESLELQMSIKNGNTIEELADVFEVIYAILKIKGWSIEDIIKVQTEKRNKRGGFEKRILMINNN